MLALGGFEVVRQWQEVLLPLALPLLAPFCNRYLVKLWPFRHLALTNLIVARLAPQAAQRDARPRARGKRNRAGSQRGRQYRKCRAARARDGRRHRDRLRRRPFARRHLCCDRGGNRAPSGTPDAAAASKRRGQGRRGTPGFCRGRGRGADDPRRRPYGCAGGFAALLSRAAFGPRRFHQWRALRLPDGGAGDALS